MWARGWIRTVDCRLVYTLLRFRAAGKQSGVASAFTASPLYLMSRSAHERERDQYALSALGKKKPSSTAGTQLGPSSDNASNSSVVNASSSHQADHPGDTVLPSAAMTRTRDSHRCRPRSCRQSGQKSIRFTSWPVAFTVQVTHRAACALRDAAWAESRTTPLVASTLLLLRDMHALLSLCNKPDAFNWCFVIRWYRFSKQNARQPDDTGRRTRRSA